MRVLIPCGGEGKRWGNHGGTPKHLVPIDGRPLLEHLLERVHQACPAAVVQVIARDFLAYKRPGALVSWPNHDRLECGVDKIMCSRPYWADGARTWIVWGDLWLTEEAAATMFADGQTGLVWYGRCGASSHTGKRWGELWGLSFDTADQALLEATCRRAAEVFRAGGVDQARARTVFQLLEGQDVTRWAQPAPSLVEIDDLTEDFDSPEDLRRWLYSRALKPATERLLRMARGESS